MPPAEDPVAFAIDISLDASGAAPINVGGELQEGIIYPPPEIRNIVDKTANFVARNGPQFEERIRENEKHNPKFCFLNPTDPYRAYYDWKVKDAKEGKAIEKKADVQKVTQVEERPAKLSKPTPKEPPAYEFSTPLPSISAQDLDILKLTAQFVARNGRDFMISLSKREMRNYQFDFLRSNHSLFPYFTKLVEQYTKVLIPPANLNARLRNNAQNKYSTLDRIRQRVDFYEYQEAEKKKAEEEADQERIAYASIDWHDFVIVDTVEFVEADERMDLPPPLKLVDLENMSLTQKKAALLFDTQETPIHDEGAEEMDVEMDEDVDMDEDNATPEPELQTAQPSDPSMKIRTDYVPKGKAPGAAEPTQICTICGITVNLSEMDEHVRIELMDPKWREQRAAYEAKKQSTNLIQGDDVARNLNNLSGYRTDIFGNEELEIGRKAREEQRQAERSKVIWDGHTASIGDATRQAQQHATMGQQMGDYGRRDDQNRIGPQVPHQQPGMHGGHMPPNMPPGPPRPYGFPPVPMPPPPSAMGRPPMPLPSMGMPRPPFPPPPLGMAPPFMSPAPPGKRPLNEQETEDPEAKKQRVEEGQLLPEAQFLARHKEPIQVMIRPATGEEDIQFQLPLTTTVSALKERIAEKTSMASSKQKLTTPTGLAMKNTATLAYYNLQSGAVVGLSTKERGGGKK
ncbi:hypothetical protein SpCBS45565_g02112 [Spizellomyces sp. 'palustris']|nr:hypothetical protein SpCBS45565_g02112 [Spizellomyces sp. 'palustris']